MGSAKQSLAVLRYQIEVAKPSKGRVKTCRLVIAHSSLPLHWDAFDATGMDKDAIEKTVALKSLEYAIQSNITDMQLGVAHKGVLRHITSVSELVPDMLITNASKAHLAELNATAVETLSILSGSKFPEKLAIKKGQNDGLTLGLSPTLPTRTIFADASYTGDIRTGDTRIGIGYVIRDAGPESENGLIEWSLKFGSAVSTTVQTSSSEVAELRAIREAVWDVAAITPDIKANERVLTIACDNQTAVDHLNLIRNGSFSHHSLAEHPDATAVIEDILEATRGITNLEFVWIRGHNGDILNRIAHSLAGYERKRGAASETPMQGVRRQITRMYLREMFEMGLRPTVVT